ncbi:MAG: selenide, water dikinase SelD [Bdellovibrionales bacterium]|nr:selenide, water dikinase SelD [Bdellovibrionales bacterium]
MTTPIYLDYNATTPLAPRVREAMLPYLEGGFGNPSSHHWYGFQAKKAVERARTQVAKLIGASPDEVLFTSGGSESNNLAIKGVLDAFEPHNAHIIISAIEHPAVSDVCEALAQKGVEVSRIPVDANGVIDLEHLARAITSRTRLISVMHANNEIGTIQPLREISQIAKNAGVLFHTDAAQSVGKIPVNVEELGVDLLSIAAHKFYGPKGIAALYCRRGVVLHKQIHGASHEHNLRAGTENVMHIVGLGAACELACEELEARMKHAQTLRDVLWQEIAAAYPSARVNGHPQERLPNTLSVTFPGIEVQTLLAGLHSVAASAGAACHAEDVTVSPTLVALGMSETEALSTVRFSTGAFLANEDIAKAAEDITSALRSLQQNSPSTSEEHLAKEVKLTRYTHGLGCACKLRPQALEKVLASVASKNIPQEALVGFESGDDAAVYVVRDDLCVVQSVDFFTPIVDSPFDFGRIAAANALSDLYAMGATPLFALNIVGFPTNRLPLEVLEEILSGAAHTAEQARIPILGGHTVEDLEPKFGMSVTGTCHPKGIWQNTGARPGDVLLLTKPLGTGILTTAMKHGECQSAVRDEAISVMAELNKRGFEVASQFVVHACTDVTGFGLLGHLLEMMKGSEVSARISLGNIHFLTSARELAEYGHIPGGSRNNLEYVKPFVSFSPDLSPLDQLLLADAQTSGGLLLSVPEDQSQELLTQLQQELAFGAAIIGKVEEKQERFIFVS